MSRRQSPRWAAARSSRSSSPGIERRAGDLPRHLSRDVRQTLEDVYHRPPMKRAEDRYLVASLEFEGVLRACLHRYTRNSADVDELLQETWAHLLAAGAAQNREEIRSIRAFALTV